MNILIDLPPDTVRKIREVKSDPEAVLRVINEDSAMFVPAVVEAVVHAPIPVPPSKRLTAEEFEALSEKLVAIMDRHPNVPNGTYSREEIYEDHPKW